MVNYHPEDTRAELRKVHGYVVEHNPVITGCIGLHSNIASLCREQQSMGSIFYTITYTGKDQLKKKGEGGMGEEGSLGGFGNKH